MAYTCSKTVPDAQHLVIKASHRLAACFLGLRCHEAAAVEHRGDWQQGAAVHSAVTVTHHITRRPCTALQLCSWHTVCSVLRALKYGEEGHMHECSGSVAAINNSTWFNHGWQLGWQHSAHLECARLWQMNLMSCPLDMSPLYVAALQSCGKPVLGSCCKVKYNRAASTDGASQPLGVRNSRNFVSFMQAISNVNFSCTSSRP